MKVLIITIALTCASIQVPIPKEIEIVEKSDAYRITEYCQECNDPQGKQSASGIQLEEGHVAMNGVPLGTQIIIEGKTYTVVDRCGIDETVDIFRNSEKCECNKLEFKKVSIVASKVISHKSKERK